MKRLGDNMEWICSVCGYVYDKENFQNEDDDYKCPLCDASKESFEQRDIQSEIEIATNEITSV